MRRRHQISAGRARSGAIGWPVRYRPSVSRSPARRCASLQSGTASRQRTGVRRRAAGASRPKKSILAGLAAARALLAAPHRRGEPVHQRGAVDAEAIAAAGADQRLEHAPVDARQIDAPAQVLEAAEGSARLALGRRWPRPPPARRPSPRRGHSGSCARRPPRTCMPRR